MTDRIKLYELKGTIEKAIDDYERSTKDNVIRLVLNIYVDMNDRKIKKQITVITKDNGVDYGRY
jgi:hypothetical protein